MQEYLRLILNHLEASYYVEQFAPLLILLVVPIFALFAKTHWSAVSWLISMVFRSLGLSVAWNWVQDHGPVESESDRKPFRRSKHVRTRSEQLELQNSLSVEEDSTEGTVTENSDDYYYPGLVNISGTYCFLNSVLQAMASLSYLSPYIDAIHAKAEELDVPTPIIDSLREMLQALNTPTSSSRALRPITLINALSNPEPGRRSKLFSSREHQDAQELFQLISECIKNESLAIDKEGQRDRGLGGLAVDVEPSSKEAGQSVLSVFDGLTANRRSCCECGYTEALMHFAFDNWQLAVPRLTGTCSLQDCLSDYIKLELLTDCICRKCSMMATHQRLVHEAEKLSESVAADSSPTSSKKKRAREARKFEAKVRAAIEEGRIEEDIKGVVMEKVFSKASTKQAMIARPPRVLALHLNRSVHYNGYTGRNSCRVLFPEILDLTPYTTSGQMSTVPSAPISAPSPPIPRSTTPTQSTFASSRVLYRLSSVVCHYGQHSFGHYVCFRRRPQRSSSGSSSTSILPHPQLSCPIGCECEDCIRLGHIRDSHPSPPGRGWLRISDNSVAECDIDRVLAEGVGAFMLFYERVIPFRPPIYSMNSPRSSEETVRPELRMGCANGSTLSISTLCSSKDAGAGLSAATVPEPRIVTRITAGRTRSNSVLSSSEMVNGIEKDRTENGAAHEDVADVESIPSSSSHPNGNGKPVEMGYDSDDAHTVADSVMEHSPKSTEQKHQVNGKSKHKGPAAPERPSSQPTISSTQSYSNIRTPSPTPSSPASRHSSKPRIKAPQPVRAHLTNANVPVRLGLLA